MKGSELKALCGTYPHIAVGKPRPQGAPGFYFDICLLIFLTKDLVLVHTPGAFKTCKHPSLGLTEGTMAVPDAQIYPHATGAAAEVVKLHQEPQDLVFWAGWVGALFRSPSIFVELTGGLEWRLLLVLPICPASLDRSRGEGNPLSVQRG